MTKSVLLGDLHFGVRSDSLTHLDFQKKFFAETLFPYMKKHKIKRIYQLGDLMDRRKFVNYHTLNQCKKMFFDPAREAGIEVIILVGNHDIYYRDSLEINSLHELFYGYENVKLVMKPTVFEEGNVKIDILPWVCKQNKKEIEEFVAQSTSDVLFAHLELAGFDMMRGMKAEHGDDATTFSKYLSVVSGHYHTRSIQGNIHYLGVPYELTWSDAGDQKGFGVFDSKTMVTEFIPNPHSIYSRIIYNDSSTDYDKVDVKQFLRSYIKIIVAQKADDKMFDRFIERIYQHSDPIDLSISDTTISYQEVEQEKIETRDPLTILISSVGDDMKDAAEIRSLVQDLYAEAISLGVTE